MKVKVVGVQSVDYISRKTNEPVKGRTLHCVYKDPQVTGEAATGIFVSDKLGITSLNDVTPGMMVNVEYNNRGFVCDMAICK